MIERKIKNAPVGQGTVRMLTREEWEEFREVRPRSPFESKLARPNARIRTEEPVRMVRHPVLFVTTSLCSLADKRFHHRDDCKDRECICSHLLPLDKRIYKTWLWYNCELSPIV